MSTAVASLTENRGEDSSRQRFLRLWHQDLSRISGASTIEAPFVEIDEHIKRVQELLFADFDDTESPHIFVIAGSGNVEYCDFQGRAAIGTGGLAAPLWMSFYGYASPMKLADRVFGSVSAKFFAERASDVGKETIVVVKASWLGSRGFPTVMIFADSFSIWQKPCERHAP